MFIVPIERPLVVSYLTSIVSDTVALTIFESWCENRVALRTLQRVLAPQ